MRCLECSTQRDSRSEDEHGLHLAVAARERLLLELSKAAGLGGTQHQEVARDTLMSVLDGVPVPQFALAHRLQVRLMWLAVLRLRAAS